MATGNVRVRLAKILFAYRLTPQTTIGLSPAEMLLGRRPISRLDLLKPHTADRVERKQLAQKSQHDRHARDRVFTEEDPVFVRNYHQGDKWLPGVISEKTGPVSFKVTMTTSQDRRCHQDQIRKDHQMLKFRIPKHLMCLTHPLLLWKRKHLLK